VRNWVRNTEELSEEPSEELSEELGEEYRGTESENAPFLDVSAMVSAVPHFHKFLMISVKFSAIEESVPH
jgi:hypothetical protein